MPAAKLCVACLVVASVLPAFAAENLPRASSPRSTEEGLRLLHQMQDGLGEGMAATLPLDGGGLEPPARAYLLFFGSAGFGVLASTEIVTLTSLPRIEPPVSRTRFHSIP